MAERADILARDEVERWRRHGVRPGLDVIRRTMEAAERGGFAHCWGGVYGHCLHALVRDHREVAEAAILEAMEWADPQVHDGAARAFLYYHGLATPWRVSDEVAERDFDKLPRPLQCVRAYSNCEVLVANGGFSHYYDGTGGHAARLLVEFLVEIGAHQSADVVRRSVLVFGDEHGISSAGLVREADDDLDPDAIDHAYYVAADGRYPRVAKFMHANRDVVGAFDGEGWEQYF